MKGGLFLPLEVVKREYLGRLCLAVEMASRGVPVFVGHKKWIIRLALRADDPGIFFYKDAARDEWFVPGLRDRGFGLVAQDEEAGIIYADYAEFFKRRQSLENIPQLDLFFSWGKDDFDFLVSRYCAQDRCNIVNAGSVKTILWGPYGERYFEKEIGAIKKRYGEFVIFITNFAVGNSYLPARDLINLGKKNYEDVENLYRERYEREDRLVRFTADAAAAIARESDLNVVIRPHPTEDVDFWRRRTKSMRGIFVEPDGDLSPWILASRGVLHNSCTSGIQAAASDVPVVAFGESEQDLEGVCSIPNQVSIRALGRDEVLSAVGELPQRWQAARSECRSVLDRKLADVGTLAPLRATADALMELGGPPNPAGNSGLGRDSPVYDLQEIYRVSRFRPRTRQTILDQRKRPTLYKRDIKRDVERLSGLLGCRSALSVTRVERNAFCIRRR